MASRCCGAVEFIAPVYLWVERQPAEDWVRWGWKHGRRLIAESITCSKCLRQSGDLKHLDGCPPEFNGTVWMEMQKKTGGDKFYCEMVDGKLQPFGGRVVKNQKWSEMVSTTVKALPTLPGPGPMPPAVRRAENAYQPEPEEEPPYEYEAA